MSSSRTGAEKQGFTTTIRSRASNMAMLAPKLRSEPDLPDQGPVRARQLADRAICCTNPTLTIH